MKIWKCVFYLCSLLVAYYVGKTIAFKRALKVIDDTGKNFLNKVRKEDFV